ncbi:MAG: hypothetical protein F6K41_14655 [Symploca sp. SIO3E6]|nr:hypothetical protein [Caldora sp. SIO3E6]
MRQINKQTEPACMPDIRREVQGILEKEDREMQSEDWDEVKGDQKQAIRESLVREQCGL